MNTDLTLPLTGGGQKLPQTLGPQQAQPAPIQTKTLEHITPPPAETVVQAVPTPVGGAKRYSITATVIVEIANVNEMAALENDNHAGAIERLHTAARDGVSSFKCTITPLPT